MLYPELEQKLQESRHTLNLANSENIFDRCKHYLGLLTEYRSKLYELQELSGVPRQTASLVLPEGALDRKVIREAIETTTRERNRTQVLLLSFTTISGYEAVEIFNERRYEGHEDWELRASGVKFDEKTTSHKTHSAAEPRAVATWSRRITRFELDPNQIKQV